MDSTLRVKERQYYTSKNTLIAPTFSILSGFRDIFYQFLCFVYDTPETTGHEPITLQITSTEQKNPPKPRRKTEITKDAYYHLLTCARHSTSLEVAGRRCSRLHQEVEEGTQKCCLAAPDWLQWATSRLHRNTLDLLNVNAGSGRAECWGDNIHICI